LKKQDKQRDGSSAGTEGGRRPTGVPAEVSNKPDSEVVVQMIRRRLNNSYKLKVLNHVDSLRDDGNGAIGAYLRKEGLLFDGSQLVKAA